MKNLVIVGAGPAGLTAAYKLVKENTGIKPIIYEASNIVGGIACTIEYKGNRMDIGGHRFFTKNDEVKQIWNELLPLQGALAYDDIKCKRSIVLNPAGPNPETEDRVFLRRRRVSRILFLKKFFSYPIAINAKTICKLGLKRMVKIVGGYARSSVKKAEEKSLADFMVNRFGKPLYETFFKDYTYKVWGRYPEEIGADWGKQRIKGLSLKKAIIDNFNRLVGRKNKQNTETSLIDEFFYPKYGPGQIWEEMAKYITENGGEIHLNTEVIGIKVECGKIREITVRNKAQEIENIPAEALFSSMPIKDLMQAIGDKNNRAYEVAVSLPYRDFITVGVLVNKLKIKNETKLSTLGNIIPDTWIYVQEKHVKMGRIQVFNNWSPYLINDVENTVWLGLEYFCNEGDELWNMAEKNFSEMAIAELVELGIIDKASVLDSHYVRVKKAYPAYFDSYNNFSLVREYIDEISNLYCIGRNGQHRYNNMDHSMLTAIRAVDALCGMGSTKSDIWNVNTDEEYHEEKRECEK